MFTKIVEKNCFLNGGGKFKVKKKLIEEKNNFGLKIVVKD